MCGCKVRRGDLRSLVSALSEFQSLREIELISCELDGNDASEIIRALAGHNDLEKLDLHSNQIGGNSCAALSALLPKPDPKLAVLDLTRNYIDDEGAANLATGLTGNSTLRELNLNDIRDITEAGWRAVFTALQSPSCRLEKLDLDSNDGNNDTPVDSATHQQLMLFDLENSVLDRRITRCI
mgnify:CR=1 FL=1